MFLITDHAIFTERGNSLFCIPYDLWGQIKLLTCISWNAKMDVISSPCLWIYEPCWLEHFGHQLINASCVQTSRESNKPWNKGNFSSGIKSPADGADVFGTSRKWLLFQGKSVIPPGVVFRGFHVCSLKPQLQHRWILFLNSSELFSCFTCTKNPCSMVGVDLQCPMACEEKSNSTSSLAPRCAGDLTAETITLCERVINCEGCWEYLNLT